MNEVQPLSSQPVVAHPSVQPLSIAPPSAIPPQPSSFAAKPPSFPSKPSNATAPVSTSFVSNGYSPAGAPLNQASQSMPPMSTTSLFPPVTPTSTAVGASSTMFSFPSQTPTSGFNPISSAASFPPLSSKPPTITAPPMNPASLSRSTPTPPAPPLSSQVPYNNARQTPDHISTQGENFCNIQLECSVLLTANHLQEEASMSLIHPCKVVVVFAIISLPVVFQARNQS